MKYSIYLHEEVEAGIDELCVFSAELEGVMHRSGDRLEAGKTYVVEIKEIERVEVLKEQGRGMNWILAECGTEEVAASFGVSGQQLRGILNYVGRLDPDKLRLVDIRVHQEGGTLQEVYGANQWVACRGRGHKGFVFDTLAEAIDHLAGGASL